MSEDGALTVRQLRREREILEIALRNTPDCRKRSVPISLFKKLLAASTWAIENGYDYKKDQRDRLS